MCSTDLDTELEDSCVRSDIRRADYDPYDEKRLRAIHNKPDPSELEHVICFNHSYNEHWEIRKLARIGLRKKTGVLAPDTHSRIYKSTQAPVLVSTKSEDIAVYQMPKSKDTVLFYQEIMASIIKLYDDYKQPADLDATSAPCDHGSATRALPMPYLRMHMLVRLIAAEHEQMQLHTELRDEYDELSFPFRAKQAPETRTPDPTPRKTSTASKASKLGTRKIQIKEKANANANNSTFMYMVSALPATNG